MNLTRFFLLTFFVFYISSNIFCQPNVKEERKEVNIIASAGLIFSKSKVHDPLGLLGSQYSGSYSIGAQYQKELYNRIFLEVGCAFNDYWLGFSINDNNPFFLGSSSSAFNSLESSYGLVYYLRTKKNRDIINMHLGLFIGYAFTSKGSDGAVGYFNTIEGQNIINELAGNVRQHSLLILGSTMGLSRDFEISDRLDIGLKFNYNFGFNKLRQIDIKYNTSSSTKINNAQSLLSGTSWQSLLYLKYRVGIHK